MARIQLVNRLVFAALYIFASRVWAEDAFYDVRIDSLKFVDGKLPQPAQNQNTSMRRSEAMRPYALIEGGEGYLKIDQHDHWNTNAPIENNSLVIRAPAGEVNGRLIVPKSDHSGMVVLKFTVPAELATADAKKQFSSVRQTYYYRLSDSRIPGTTWFRYQMNQASREPGAATREFRDRAPDPNDVYELTRTFDLFSGSRAIDENLQLDRVWPRRGKAVEQKVKLNDLPGITIVEFDWKKLTEGLKPQPDPLAALIPGDQHVIFFPSFQEALKVADEASVSGIPLLQYAEPRSQDAGVRRRYERQLCLSLSGLGKLLGPALINSVAITGSDPYWRVGSDVAVLFEAKNPDILLRLLAEQIEIQRKGEDAQPIQGQIESVSYTGAVSADRKVCSYLAALKNNCIVVTNSLVQLKRLATVGTDASPTLATLPEYTFFRERYKRGNGEESALVIISDLTIRRWCSAKWRIASSRRTLAAALMAEIQADNLQQLIENKPASPKTDRPMRDLGELRFSSGSIFSSGYGSLEFMTPIAEMPMERVTEDEATSYKQWRDSYQKNWRWAFDPIAIRLKVEPKRLAADITVVPLIAASVYSTIADVAGDAKISARSGDPHQSMLHLAVALDHKSGLFKSVNNQLSLLDGMINLYPLAWMGDCISIYAEDGPFWAELAKAGDPEEFAQKNLSRIPAALYIASTDPVKLTLFMTLVHGFMSQSGPGLINWEPLKHNEQPYVKISANGKNTDLPENTSIYYVAAPEALIITFNESTVKQAIDRLVAQRGAKDGKSAVPAMPWLGSSLCFQTQKNGMNLLASLDREDYQHAMQERAWSNLPILNEWKRLFPGEDPVKLHERLWYTRLQCPGGGSYAWNERFGTMESTIYGHPGEPKDGPKIAPQLEGLLNGNFGIGFENGGLRGRAEIERVAKSP